MSNRTLFKVILVVHNATNLNLTWRDFDKWIKLDKKVRPTRIVEFLKFTTATIFSCSPVEFQSVGVSNKKKVEIMFSISIKLI